jgi:hypothetical protein
MNPKWLRGKTISNVEMRPFEDGRGGKAHAPVIRFTDGTCITFTAEETEAESGVGITYHKRKP